MKFEYSFKIEHLEEVYQEACEFIRSEIFVGNQSVLFEVYKLIDVCRVKLYLSIFKFCRLPKVSISTKKSTKLKNAKRLLIHLIQTIAKSY